MTAVREGLSVLDEHDGSHHYPAVLESTGRPGHLSVHSDRGGVLVGGFPGASKGSLQRMLAARPKRATRSVFQFGVPRAIEDF